MQFKPVWLFGCLGLNKPKMGGQIKHKRHPGLLLIVVKTRPFSKTIGLFALPPKKNENEPLSIPWVLNLIQKHKSANELSPDFSVQAEVG